MDIKQDKLVAADGKKDLIKDDDHQLVAGSSDSDVKEHPNKDKADATTTRVTVWLQ